MYHFVKHILNDWTIALDVTMFVIIVENYNYFVKKMFL